MLGLVLGACLGLLLMQAMYDDFRDLLQDGASESGAAPEPGRRRDREIMRACGRTRTAVVEVEYHHPLNRRGFHAFFLCPSSSRPRGRDGTSSPTLRKSPSNMP